MSKFGSPRRLKDFEYKDHGNLEYVVFVFQI